nr:MAG TPA: hypothetical protein [Ackermannviridae sp.]
MGKIGDFYELIFGQFFIVFKIRNQSFLSMIEVIISSKNRLSRENLKNLD